MLTKLQLSGVILSPPSYFLFQVVELENNSARRVTKYLVIVATNGHMATEETIVLGTEQEDSRYLHNTIMT